jgi:hypothetical protein
VFISNELRGFTTRNKRLINTQKSKICFACLRDIRFLDLSNCGIKNATNKNKTTKNKETALVRLIDKRVRMTEKTKMHRSATLRYFLAFLAPKKVAIATEPTVAATVPKELGL